MRGAQRSAAASQMQPLHEYDVWPVKRLDAVRHEDCGGLILETVTRQRTGHHPDVVYVLEAPPFRRSSLTVR